MSVFRNLAGTTADEFSIGLGTSKIGLRTSIGVAEYQDYGGAWKAFNAVPATITIANEAADTTCYPLFVTAATGNLGPKTNAGLAYDSSAGILGTLRISASATLTDIAVNTYSNIFSTTFAISSDNSKAVYATGSKLKLAPASGMTNTGENMANITIVEKSYLDPGTISMVTGNQVRFDLAGNVTTVKGNSVSGYGGYNATTSLLYGYYIADMGPTAAVSNLYGFYMASQVPTGSGAITNKYGVYIADTTAKNYFGGTVGIGVAATSYALSLSASGMTLASTATIDWGAGNARIVEGSYALKFLTYNAGSVLCSERMRIDTNGNVIIGATSSTSIFSVSQPVQGCGTVTITTNTTCTGSGTTFLTTFKVGDSIIITATGETRAISAIASDTVMTIASATNTVASKYTLAGRTCFTVSGNGQVYMGVLRVKQESASAVRLYAGDTTTHCALYFGDYLNYSATCGVSNASIDATWTTYSRTRVYLSTLDNYLIQHNTATSDIAAKTLTIQGQSPWLSSVTNIDGGKVIIQGGQPRGAGLYGDITIQALGGNAGIGCIPTARLHLPAGTATAGTAPLKLTQASAVLLTAAEAGAIECDDGDNLYYTIKTGAARKTIAFRDDVTYIGTTSVALNRTSGALSLTGVNIDGTAAAASTVTVANEIDDTECCLLFTTASTGNLQPKTNTALTYDSAAGKLKIGGSLQQNGVVITQIPLTSDHDNGSPDPAALTTVLTSGTLLAGKTYSFRGILVYKTNAYTTGIAYGLHFSSAPASFSLNELLPLANGGNDLPLHSHVDCGPAGTAKTAIPTWGAVASTQTGSAAADSGLPYSTEFFGHVTPDADTTMSLMICSELNSTQVIALAGTNIETRQVVL